MERQAGLKTGNEQTSILVIIIFHAVGLLGFMFAGSQPFFLKLVPYHLLLMFAVIAFNHHKVNLKFLYFLFLVFILGYAAEWIGVNKHWLFGSYTYGAVLGFKIGNVPLLIGLNWFLLSYATGVITQFIKIHRFTRLILGAIMMVFLDMIIEPVAVKYNYWHWQSPGHYLAAPTQNYADWFLVSFVLLSIFNLSGFSKQNKAPVILYLAQLSFFAVLNFI